MFERYRALSLPRRWIADIVHFGMKSSVTGGATVFHLQPVAAARRFQPQRISWAAIFVKAIAIAGRRCPALRQSYIPYPWQHIYEHPDSVVAIVIEREWHGGAAVFFDHIHSPDCKALTEIDAVIRSLKSLPITMVGAYRRLIRFARLPLFIRRLIWQVALLGCGRLRSRYLGTASVNSLPARDALVLQSATPLTLSIFFSPLGPKDEMKIQAYFDHRVIDGMEIYRLLRELEKTLNGEIADELRQSRGRE